VVSHAPSGRTSAGDPNPGPESQEAPRHASAANLTRRSRAVLDTNVWLDWVLFDDLAVAPLKTARSSGALEIAIDAPCRCELAVVLGYPRFGLDARTQARMLSEVESLCVWVDISGDALPHALPRCRDPDDVKFLSLALAARADWLISKDKALLALARKTARLTALRIGTPARWAEATTCHLGAS
jgi:putative PIN family toxin of toxin-antitoxin system